MKCLKSFTEANVDAKIIRPYFANPFEPGAGLEPAERARLVVDEFGKDVGNPTKRYTLVRTPEVAAVVSLAADAVGLNLEPHAGWYRNGKSYLVWQAPDQKIPLRNGGSVTPWFTALNGYGQGTPLVFDASGCNSVCLNMQHMGVLLAIEARRKHQGDIQLMEIVQPLMQKFVDKVEVYQLELEIMQNTNISFANPVYQQIKEATPERYHARLGQAIRENAREYGHTAMAALQAATEVGSHDMPGVNAIEWTKRVTQLISAAVEAEGVELPVTR